MVAQNLLTGRWPRQEVEITEIDRALRENLGQNTRWGIDTILGFPSMSPHPFGLQAFSMFASIHPNAILTHTRGSGEKGFDGVGVIERDLILSVGDLLGDDNVDGYVAPGGTEANIMGIWIGREKLRKEFGDPQDRRVAVLASPASHYSLRKACALTDLGRGAFATTGKFPNPMSCKGELLPNHHIPASDGNGLRFVRSNQSGQIDVTELEATIRNLFADKGIVRFIIFLNEGTTLTGAMDDTAAVGKLIGSLKAEFGNTLGFYIHVDAAYGGFIYPFLEPDGQWAFRVPEVDSVTIDPYKMGQCPMAEGLFLCRKHHQQFIEQGTGYVNDGHDDTLCGSRSGAYAASCWAVIQAIGSAGYTKLHSESRKIARLLYSKLQGIPGISLLPQNLNMVSFVLPDDLPLEIYEALDRDIIRPFLLMWDWFNPDPNDPDSRPFRVVKCNITRDVKTEWLDQFAEALRGVLARKMERV